MEQIFIRKKRSCFTPPPPKSNVDTTNDGFEMYLRLQIWRHFGYPAVSFRGCNHSLTTRMNIVTWEALTFDSPGTRVEILLKTGGLESTPLKTNMLKHTSWKRRSIDPNHQFLWFHSLVFAGVLHFHRQCLLHAWSQNKNQREFSCIPFIGVASLFEVRRSVFASVAVG